MLGKANFGLGLSINTQHNQWVGSAVAVLLVLTLHCFDLHAALLFRSLEQVNGQQRWSAIRKYSSPIDIAYAQVTAGGAVAPADEVRVFLSGEITRADVDSLAVMESLLKSGKQKIAGNLLWLASNGGDIDAAMELGRRLRKLGIYTVIGKNDQCSSACVFAFMGGERRSVAGRLGIHRPYFPFTEGTPDRQARFRHLQKTLKDFVAEMDFPDSLYEAVMLVPPESVQIVSPGDLKRFYLEGISPSSEDLADAASARRMNLSMFEYLQRKAKMPACSFFDAGPGRCEAKMQDAATRGGAADDPGIGEATSSGRADSIPAARHTRLKKPSEGSSRSPL